MKKIMIIDGGPRKNYNSASIIQKFVKGASSASYREEHWREDLQKAFDAGIHMAESIKLL